MNKNIMLCSAKLYDIQNCTRYKTGIFGCRCKAIHYMIIVVERVLLPQDDICLVSCNAHLKEVPFIHKYFNYFDSFNLFEKQICVLLYILNTKISHIKLKHL